MMSFVNPGLLGSPAVFQRVFVGPIEASQDATASPEQAEVGATRATEMQRRIAPFILRRTAAINERYLPTCTTVVVFCRPTAAQLAAYRLELYGDADSRCRGDPLALRRLMGASGVESAQALSVISRLRQICNHAAFATASPEVRHDLLRPPAPVPDCDLKAHVMMDRSFGAAAAIAGVGGRALDSIVRHPVATSCCSERVQALDSSRRHMQGHRVHAGP